MANYKLYTLNCRGLNNTIKRRRLVTILNNERPDIVFLQETLIKLLTYWILSSNKLLHQFHAPGSSKARGVAILISKDLHFSVLGILSDTEDLFFWTAWLMKYTLASFYAPNINQISFLNLTLYITGI